MNKSFVYRTAGILGLIILLGITGILLRYMLVDDTDSYTRIMLHQLHESPQNIDIAFVGSSHMYKSVIPGIADEETGLYTFNAGSSQQYMDGSYAMIRELCACNDPQSIYLEVFYGVASGLEYEDRTQMTPVFILSDYMRPSVRKAELILHGCPKDYWVDAFIPARRNWRELFNAEYIRDNIRKKNTDNYRHYIYDRIDDTEYYYDRGYVANTDVWPQDDLINRRAYGPLGGFVSLPEDSDWYGSLLQIIRFCERKHIDLNFVVAPEPEWSVIGKGNYGDYYDRMSEIAGEYGIDYYDFNLCRAEYFDAKDLSLFYDDQHLNYYGAMCFTRALSELISGRVSPDRMFYPSLSDKMNDGDPVVYGIAVSGKDSGNGSRKAYVITNRAGDIECEVYLKDPSGRKRVLQEYSSSEEFIIEEGETRVIAVDWQGSGVPESGGHIETSSEYIGSLLY